MRTFFAKYGAGVITGLVSLPLIYWAGITYGIVVQLVTAVICVIMGYAFGLMWGFAGWSDPRD